MRPSLGDTSAANQCQSALSLIIKNKLRAAKAREGSTMRGRQKSEMIWREGISGGEETTGKT